MKSVVTPEFRKCLAKLPVEVQKAARKSYNLWKTNRNHRGLNFRQLKPHQVYSVRIGLHYRAICAQVEPEVFIWDWIGTHSDYDKLVDALD